VSAVLQFDDATHTYTLGGRKLPSVTQVCGVLDPDAFARVPPAVLARKRLIGVALHRAIQLDAAGELDEDTLAPEVAPYFAAWRDFLLRTRAKVIQSEQQVGSSKWGYAGTLDLTALLDSSYWLLDVKSVAILSPVTAVQVAAYAELVNHDYPVGLRRGALHLKPDGRFGIREYHGGADWSTFLSALQVYRWRAANLTH
jgi:hypothetical protein